MNHENLIDNNKKLSDRCDKMAFLLGIAWSFINGSRETFKIHGLQEPESYKEGCVSFLKGIEELFYSKVENDAKLS